MVKTAWS